MKSQNQEIIEDENISELTNTVREVDQIQENKSPETASTLPIKSQVNYTILLREIKSIETDMKKLQETGIIQINPLKKPKSKGQKVSKSNNINYNKLKMDHQKNIQSREIAGNPFSSTLRPVELGHCVAQFI